MANLRRNVRATLQREVVVKGSDPLGQPFELPAQSVDFSRSGLGLIVTENVLAPGSVVSISLARQFHSYGTVRWIRPEPGGRLHVGVLLIDPKVSAGLRIAAAVLLAVALIGQISYSRSKGAPRSRATTSCGVTVSELKSRVAEVLGPLAAVGPNEKAFLHVQHEHMGCDEYTRMFEKSEFFPDAALSEALRRWHWETYHSADASTHRDAVRGAEAALSAGR